MKNLIKLGLLLCLALTQTSVNAQDAVAPAKKVKILVGTSNIAPYITDVISPNFASDIKDGKEITEILKILAASGKVDVTVVAPMMLGMYKSMPQYNIKSSETYIKVPMPYGDKGASVDVQVMLYETTTNYGVKVIFVGEPFESGLFKETSQREISYVQKTLEKYSFLSKAILEIAKLNTADPYDVIHTFRWTTSMVPWYKKYWGRYSSITAKTAHTFFMSDVMALNAEMAVNEYNKNTLQIEDKYFNEFIEGSVASHNKIRLQKMVLAVNLKTDMVYPELSEETLNELILLYQHLAGEDIVDLRLAELLENSTDGDLKTYITNNATNFGNKEFLDALATRAENADGLSEKMDLSSKAKLIASSLVDIKFPMDQTLYNRIIALPQKITAGLEDQQRNNIMSYLKTKNMESKKDAISYFEKNFSKILKYAKEGDNLDVISSSKEDMLALTAAYIFVFEDNGAFLTPESYTMFMGTTKNESLDGLLDYLNGSPSPIFSLYKALASVLIVTNTANDNVSKYYVKGAEKDVPKDLMGLIKETTLGKDFADHLVVKGGTDIETLYLTTTLKGILPEKTEVTNKLKTIEGMIKK